MEGAQELRVIMREARDAETADIKEDHVTTDGTRRLQNFKWWLLIAVYTLFVLAGQSAATLLGRLYYDNGGGSKWIATLVQLAGFPILFLYYLISPLKQMDTNEKPAFTLKIGSIYVSLGLLVAAECYLYSVGLLYLPVSTYSLICASQLAFNALFSYFLNAQKLTPPILNSLILLTISSTLLIFDNESRNPTSNSRGKYVIGFICTLGASAAFALVLSLTQLAFQKVIKTESFSAVRDMVVYQSLVASCVILVGLFASGEWKDLSSEMTGYRLGEVSYVMNLVWTAVCWQLFAIGSVGLIFEVSSLFSNAISVVGLPIVPLLAVIFFHDKMDGLKAIALVLAIWGFISYVYQHYLDDKNLKTTGKTNANEVLNGAST